MSLTRVNLCCAVLLAWATLAPVQAQDASTRPGRAKVGRAQVGRSNVSQTRTARATVDGSSGDSFEMDESAGDATGFDTGIDRGSPVRAQSPELPPQPELDAYYPDAGTPGYDVTPSASGYVPIDPFGTRFSFRSDIGNGPGWAQGSQALNGFVPITFEPDRSILFVDGRAIVTNDGDFVGSAGAGMRIYSPELDRVNGGSFWYDYDNSNATNYDQWGISLESLGKYFDVRLNAYIPSNDNQRTLSSGLNGKIFYVKDNIGLGNTRVVENALRGGDVEIGGALPFLGDYGLRSYIGGYYFQAPTVETTLGFKWRSELQVTEDVIVGMAASTDKLFGQNFFGSVTIYMPDGRPQRIMSRQPTRERLYTNVERNYRVNVYHRTLNETLRAINPDTGLPYVVHHVDNNFTAGTGDGKVKSPYGTLADASPGADIIFVHHNAVDGNGVAITDGYDSGIVLDPNQRLLGQGTEHFFEELTYGTLTLPGNDGGPRPFITNTVGDVVTLASNNEVSGFQIGGPAPNAPAGNGIFGVGITDFNINRNTIQNADLAGISLVDASGTGSITSNNLANNGLENISIINNGAPALTLEIVSNDAQASLAGAIIRGDASDITATIFDNNFSNNLNTGLAITAANGGTTDATVSNNVFNQNGGNGFEASADAGTLTLALTDNSANSNSQNGFDLSASNLGLMTLTASDNAINANTLDGLHVFADNGTIDFSEFSFNTLNTNGEQGITLNADNGGVLTGTFASNSVQNNLLGGLDSVIDNGAQSILTLENNTFNANTGFGLSFSALNGSLINNTLNSNTIDNNVGPGVLLSGSSSSDVRLAMDSNSVVNNQGIGFDSSITDSVANITLTNNDFTANLDAGIRLGYTGATTGTQLIDGNTISDTVDDANTASPTGEGIIVALNGTGGVPNVSSTIQNNTIQNNEGDGILETLNVGSSNLSVNDIVNNNILGNGRDGLSMQLNFGSTAVLNASNNAITTQTATRTGVNGINLDLQANSTLNASISDNTIDGSSDGTNFSTGSGVLMNIQGDGTLISTLTNNLIREHGVDGVHVGPDPFSNGQAQGGFTSAQGTATISVTLNQNLIELNQDDGVQVSVSQVTEGAAGLTGVANYTLVGNTIRNNGTVVGNVRTGSGLNAEVRSGIMNLLATNNSITDNASDGILLRNSMGAGIDAGVQIPGILLYDNSPKAIMNATIDGNTITGNGNRGVNIRYEDLTINATGQSLGAVGDVRLTNNIISGNRDEGVYVLMNNQRDEASLFGTQAFIDVDENNPFGDPTAVANRYPAFTTFPDYFINFANSDVFSDLKFTAVGNTISNNGGGNPADPLGQVAGDGMLLLVGTSSYLHADVRDNQFSGNFQDDFRTDSFISQPDALPAEADTPTDTQTRIYLDHISLLDLRFTGNTGNSIGGVTSSSDSDRSILGATRPGRYNNTETVNGFILKSSRRRTDYFRIEDTPNPAGSVLNGTNVFTAPDSTNPRNNFLNSGYVQVPIGSLFP
jgi:hypothetical protein